MKQPALIKEVAREAIIKLAESSGGRETRPYERLDDLRAGGAIECVSPDGESRIVSKETRAFHREED